MDELNILPAEREKYWMNRLSSACVRCKEDLYKAANANGIYRYEACGHAACQNCQTNYLQNKADCCICSTPKGKLQFDKPTFAGEWNIFRVEISTMVQHNKDEKEELARTVKEKSEKQTMLEQENSVLKKNLEKMKKRELGEMMNTRCMECGYDVVFERSRICISCGIDNHFLCKKTAEDGEEWIQITSYEKAEDSLLCGSCILDGNHGQHKTENYYQMKTEQLSVSHNNDANRRLKNAFDGNWDTLCQKMNKCHSPIVEFLMDQGAELRKQDTWMKFKKTQIKLNHIVQLVTEHKANMVGSMHQYTGSMKALLAEVRAISQDPEQSYTVEHEKDLDQLEEDLNDAIESKEKINHGVWKECLW